MARSHVCFATLLQVLAHLLFFHLEGKQQVQEQSQQRADAVGRLQDDDEGVAPHLLAVIVLHAAVPVVSDAGSHGASGHDRGRVSAAHASAVDLTSVSVRF